MNLRNCSGRSSPQLFSSPYRCRRRRTPTPTHRRPVNQDLRRQPGRLGPVSEYSGLCIQTLVCPAVDNTWAPGGADGNGYIRTQFGSIAATLAGSSTGVWDSPVFTYNGLNGKTPGSVTFDMSILRGLGALLDLSVLNDSAYQVDLVDQDNGTKVSVVPSTKIRERRTGPPRRRR